MKKLLQSWKSFWANRSSDNMFRLDGAVPFSKGVAFGVQHVLSMFVSNILPILLLFVIAGSTQEISAKVISNGIRCAIFIAAIGTAIQLYPIGPVGSRLPVVLGSSFTF